MQTNSSFINLAKHLILASEKLNLNYKAPEKKFFSKKKVERKSAIKLKKQSKTEKIENLQKDIPEEKTTEKKSLEGKHKTEFPIKFGKIDDFVEDDSISAIICEGPNTLIKIKKSGKVLNTNILLKKEEIDSIILKFAEHLKLKMQPIFKAKMKNLSITAVSSLLESKFLITKI